MPNQCGRREEVVQTVRYGEELPLTTVCRKP
jgi:hypothetical protein